MTVFSIESDLQLTASSVHAELTDGYQLQVDMLESWLCRVAVVPRDGLVVKNTWMIAPEDDIPWAGRDRLSNTGFSGVPLKAMQQSSTGVVGFESETLQVVIARHPLAIEFKRKTSNGWQRILQDRPMAAYRVLPGRGQLHHAQTRPLNARHLGLGDKAGALDRTGGRFRCLQTDALGYNAETSDPLYKHTPWLITGNPVDGYCGLFYDTMSECVFDLGAEHSNYHDHYRTVESYETALVYYVVLGPRIKDIVPRYQRLVGKPHLQPRWASGFAHTSMHHADADNAQEVMTNFVDQCRSREMPISALHSGSGYTTREDGRRYVFTWNTAKFPNRKEFFQHLRQANLYSCANIKPVLLKEHPLFDEVEALGGFIKRADGQPAIEMFWGGSGASLDFTNPAAVAWWQQGVRTQVLGEGFTSTWNDNNECEMWDEGAVVHGFGESLNAMDVRPLQALLMLRASFEAAIEFDPVNRPYTISRAGPVGISRYAQTWSGDNHTSWHTLKWNLANGLSMSLSGFPLVGHDIGGFVGPKPDAELLCRWFEMMALHPRAVMNSWKPQEDNPASLPWMHADVEQNIKSVLTLRYQLLPWLYHLGWQSHSDGMPVITPMLYYFDDDQCQSDASQFMVGESVLVAPVVEAGVTQREVYLPECEGGWYEWKPDAEAHVQWHAGGQTLNVNAPLGKLPLFVKSGALLPIAKSWHLIKPHDATELQLTYFAPKDSGSSQQAVFYDDGLTWDYKTQPGANLRVTATSTATSVTLEIEQMWPLGESVVLSHAVVGLGSREFVWIDEQEQEQGHDA